MVTFQPVVDVGVMARVARSSMFKSSIFCPKQYIFAVLAANEEKELTPPLNFFASPKDRSILSSAYPVFYSSKAV